MRVTHYVAANKGKKIADFHGNSRIGYSVTLDGGKPYLISGPAILQDVRIYIRTVGNIIDDSVIEFMKCRA